MLSSFVPTFKFYSTIPIDELDRIIQKLYEYNISGRITDERYDKMSQSYESEQSSLTKKLAELEEAEASYSNERNSINDFIGTSAAYFSANNAERIGACFL